MARSKSSARWLQRHFADPYVKQAQREGYASRAVFKLQELNEREALIRPGMTVVDLGAAPGGWTQLAAQAVGAQGRVVAVDILPMEVPSGAEFIQGDFCEQAVFERLLMLLGERVVGLVISDLAPNISGVNAVDQPRAMYLAELALDLARRVLAPGGDFLVKAFQGEGFDAFLAEARRSFRRVAIRKPKASRARSREVYVVARNFIL